MEIIKILSTPLICNQSTANSEQNEAQEIIYSFAQMTLVFYPQPFSGKSIIISTDAKCLVYRSIYSMFTNTEKFSIS